MLILAINSGNPKLTLNQISIAPALRMTHANEVEKTFFLLGVAGSDLDGATPHVDIASVTTEWSLSYHSKGMRARVQGQVTRPFYQVHRAQHHQSGAAG